MSKLVQLKDGTGNIYPITQATVLYDNATGTTGTVTLSETSANFDYIEVFFKNTNTNINGYLKVYNPNQKYANLFVQSGETALLQIDSSIIYINGTSITKSTYFRSNMGNTIATWSANNIIITRVVGYR